jgi:AraC family transcriptional regulator, regulatory protein of adaptative response / DNA-3-methyladenine glycosylase II
VRTTRIYCRPVCPARTPRLANCEFVPSAAAAPALGCRPCLRCRPEAAPGTPAWLGTSATVSRALRLIGDGALDQGSVDELAARLGVGGRHLRRLFERHLGATPLAVAQTRRLLFAKRLLDETSLPIARVAEAAGFASLRRFNDAIQRTYRRPPRELRRTSRSGSSELALRLAFRPPFDWDALLAYLAGRATPGVERVVDGVYRRTFELGAVRGWLEMARDPSGHALRAQIHANQTSALIVIAERLRRIFDLDADPGEIARDLGGDPLLGPSLRAHPGLRIPGSWDAFELAVRAILGQQVTVKGATTLAGRLAERFGERLDGAPPELSRLFPVPAVLARADLESIGLPQARARAIAGLAQRVAAGELALDAADGLDAAVARLCALPGIGEWTAQYVALRALREPDAFPAGDLGLRRAAAPRGGSLSALELARLAEGWRPWRAYAALHLWTRGSAA